MSDTDTMPDPTAAGPATSVALDRQDERLRGREAGVRGLLRAGLTRARGGDLGLLPVALGLVIIWTVFQSLNDVFLNEANLVDLAMQCAPVGVISLGIVCVLLVGQIDLSVGSVSGLSSAITAVLFVQHGQPAVLAVVAAIACGSGIGWLYAQMFNRLSLPSFVITLAGLLAFLGVQLYVIGKQGAINLPFDSGLVHFAQLAFVPHWLSYVLAALGAVALFVTGYARAAERRAAGLSGQSLAALVVRSAALLVVLAFVAWYLNRDRGVGWMVVLFIGLVLLLHYFLTRTSYGRAVFAVGGNVEAARRAGIDVRRVYTSMFVLCSTLAAVGGVLAAARLAAANQSSGGGDVNLNAIAAAVIGGTSLFGGRGSAFAALLGIVVIQSISSGLTLLNLDSSFRFMITGLVLVVAVALDSLARRSRATSGRA